MLVAIGIPEARLTAKGYGAQPPERVVFRIQKASNRLDDLKLHPLVRPTNGSVTSGVSRLTIVRFDANDVAADDRTELILYPLIGWLQAHPDAKITISGHTDDTEDPQLGLQRASAVGQLLIRSKIDGNRMTMRNEGASSPQVPNESAENRAQNRRVEIVIVGR
jgi:outer membrane protein OmpA-like peptidoglycan-associated protein